jgi:hypothetical protein
MAICLIGGRQDVFSRKNGEYLQALTTSQLACDVSEDDLEHLVSDGDTSILQVLECHPAMDMR